MQIKHIESANPIPEAPHKLHVVLRVVVDTPEGPVEKSREIPVRKTFYESLTATKKLAYATKCHRLHHLEDQTVRAEFDADDQARADAAAAAAKAIEYAKLVVTPSGFVADEEGTITGVQVSITHQGYTCAAVIDPDPATAEANALAAWTASKAAADAQAALLASFAIG